MNPLNPDEQKKWLQAQSAAEAGEDDQAFSAFTKAIAQRAYQINLARVRLGPAPFTDDLDAIQRFEEAEEVLKRYVQNRNCCDELNVHFTRRVEVDGGTRKYEIRAVEVELDHNPQFTRGDATDNMNQNVGNKFITGVAVRGYIADITNLHGPSYSSRYSSSQVPPP